MPVDGGRARGREVRSQETAATLRTGGLPAFKETCLAIADECFQETARLLTWAQEQLVIVGTAVLGCLEDKLRDALHPGACRCLEALLNDPAVRVPDDHTRPGESCQVGGVFWQGAPETPNLPAAAPAQPQPVFPARGERVAGSTRYVTSTDTASAFGVELRHLALRQGVGLARRVGFLGGRAGLSEPAGVCGCTKSRRAGVSAALPTRGGPPHFVAAEGQSALTSSAHRGGRAARTAIRGHEDPGHGPCR